MDKTLVYAEMCSEANEDLHTLERSEKWEAGDFYCVTISSGPIVLVLGDAEDEPYEMYHPIWMLRQDQLQDIMLPDEAVSIDIMQLLEKFFDWLNETDNRGKRSMEQLWLAFVMNKKFNKDWNGEKWILLTST